MDRKRVPWTEEETNALRAGVAKHGKGRWADVKQDSHFSRILNARSTVDLKDKFRNLEREEAGAPCAKKPRQKIAEAAEAAVLPTRVQAVERRWELPSQLVKLTIHHPASLGTIVVAVLAGKCLQVLLDAAKREFYIRPEQNVELHSGSKVLDPTQPVSMQCTMFDLLNLVEIREL